MAMRLYDLSIRHKLPLWGAGLILATAGLVAIPFLVETHDEVKHDMLFDSEALGLTLAAALNTSMANGDAERAGELIRAPFVAQQNNSYFQFEAILAIDRQGRVFASSNPATYSTGSALDSLGGQFALLWSRLGAERNRTLFDDRGDKTLVALPIRNDAADLGSLVIVHSATFYWDRYQEAAQRAALYTLLALCLLLPASWYWGARMARPLTQLAGHLDTPEGHLPGPLPHAYPYRDELGQLFRQFNQLTGALQDKERLRQAVLESERLATLGRMSAGIAHEINNPLGGLLTAIDTLKRHGRHDPVTDRIVPLLERGLQQIRGTVSAMLVEVGTANQRNLIRQDIDDVASIARQGARKPGTRLVLDNRVEGEIALPANLVRQVLINLLLNACQAAGSDGVQASVGREDGVLVLGVANGGPAIPAEVRDRLFDPFIGSHEDGHGLGLWVTRQIVDQLDGVIEVESSDGLTRFTVTLPIGKSA
ncbi:MAG: HAMP domain-containing histidine kinase [Thiobacillus sp.]|nr:HAMP domain-containing histidine kinase [Thiobacillus sp.]